VLAPRDAFADAFDGPTRRSAGTEADARPVRDEAIDRSEAYGALELIVVVHPPTIPLREAPRSVRC
jgi:hypothetical protein